MPSRTRQFLMLGNRGGGTAVALPTYSEKVLSYSPAFYWPLDELSGTTAVNAANPGVGDGTYSGVTLDSLDGPDAGARAGLWDGVNDYCNLYSLDLASGFPYTLGTFMMWSYAPDYSHIDPDFILSIGEDTSNRLRWYTQTSPDGLNMDRIAAGAADGVRITPTINTWQHLTITWNTASDRVRVYLNGAQSGTDQTTLGIWNTPTLVSTLCVIGANNTTPGNPFNGYFMHAAIFSTELAAADILDLATI